MKHGCQLWKNSTKKKRNYRWQNTATEPKKKKEKKKNFQTFDRTFCLQTTIWRNGIFLAPFKYDVFVFRMESNVRMFLDSIFKVFLFSVVVSQYLILIFYFWILQLSFSIVFLIFFPKFIWIIMIIMSVLNSFLQIFFF